MMAGVTTATLPRLRMTEEEYLCKYADELPPWEFDNGEAYLKRAMTKPAHVIVAEEFSAAFRIHRTVAGGFSGQTPTTNTSIGLDRQWRVPDFGYWPRGRRVTDGENFLPPALGIEIISPGQTARRMRVRCRWLLTRGIDVVWLVHPVRRWVEAFGSDHAAVRLPADGALESRHLPGFRLSLKDLFAPLDEPLD